LILKSLVEIFFAGKGTSKLRSRAYLPTDLKQLSWQQFEGLVAELLARHYEGDAMLTQEGGDKGADVIVKGEKNVLVQVKHVKNEKLGSESPLREIYTAQKRYGEAMGVDFGELIVATNAKKTAPHVKDQLNTFRAKLYDFKMLSKLMKQHQVTQKDVLRRMNMRRYVIR